MQLSKSGKAVFVKLGTGRDYCTSVHMIKMLIEGNATGNFIMLTELTRPDDKGIGSMTLKNVDDGKPKSGFEEFQ